MANSSILQGLQDLLFFPLKDSGAKKKLLIAGLLGLAGFIVPIIPSIFLIGYAGLIMRSVIHDRAEPYMPEWKDWSGMFSIGLKLFGAGFVFSLPAILALMLGYTAFLAPAFIEGIVNPRTPAELTSATGIILLSTFGGMAIFAVGFILSLLLWLVLPPMLSHVAATNSFAAAFHFREWWRILRANIGGFAVTLVLVGGTYLLLLLGVEILYFTIILCIVVPFLLAFIAAYVVIIAQVLFAQAYREGVEKLPAQTAKV